MSGTENYDAVIVGAGVSGLLSALALSKEGKKVLVLEKEDYIGGTCRTYDYDGYKVDTGPHIITRLDTGPLRVLMDRYFDLLPFFVPFGKYYLRIKGQVKQFPWSVKDWMMFELLPVEDRSLLVKIIFDVAYMANTGVDMNRVSIADITPRYLSPTSKAFIDYLSYFMLGTGPVNAPVSRFLDRKSYKVERPKDDNGITIPYVGKAYNMLVGGRPTDQFYPRGGIQTIVDALSYSLPESVKINLEETLLKVNSEYKHGKPTVQSVTTDKATYETELVIYSGYATDLPNLIDTDLSNSYVNNLKKIEKVNSLSVWMGLDEPIFKDEGSEMWVSTSQDTFHTWMIPTSNYDPTLAPKDKHLVGFAFIVPPDMPHEKAEAKARHTIFSNIPKLEKHMDMIHYQHLVPEKATWSIHAGFGDIKTPVENLFCVGSDSFKRSMGLTRASYSVHKMLDTLGVEGILS